MPSFNQALGFLPFPRRIGRTGGWILLTLCLQNPSFLFAQQSGVVGMSERQIRILQERSQWAKNQIAKAQEALSSSSLNGPDYESAFALAKSACDALPAGGDSTTGLRALATDTFSKAALGLAKMRISQGRFEDAEQVITAVTEKPYSSTYAPLLSLKKDLQNPDRFNRTETPGFIAKVEELKQLLSDGQGYYDSGRFDAAFKAYEKVLNLDPQNTAARLGMEQVNKQRTDYAQTAYNERRGEMLEQVAKAWELPVPKFDTGAPTIVEQSPIEVKNTGAISRKLQEIRIPQLTLSDESVRDAVEKLQKKSRTLDTTETDPAKRGVNIVLKLDPAKESVDGGTKINLSLNDLPLGEALKYIASAANLKVKIEPYAVAIVPLSEPTETLISKEYKVPPGFITSASSSGSSTAPTPGTPGLPQTTGKAGAKEFLESQGVTFPAGASATYLASSSKLLVKNTQANLDLIDSLVEVSLATPPSQVEIEARFLEVSQNNLQELGFDWLLGAFNLSGGSGFYGGGGTKGNQQGGGPYPFVQSASPAGPVGNITGDGTGNLTAGNRTGSAAVTANALDGLLLGSPAGPAAGVLALAGVFTNPQFQVVLRALNQQKGVDLVSAPKVTVTSGRKATINITRKFPYPRDYSPPQVPQTQGNGSLNPATPATPTSFETRNVGVQLEVEPTVGPDGYTIELSLSPQITEFQGFVNYGSPIQTVAPVQLLTPTAFLGINTTTAIGSKQIILTQNVINQPVFSVRQVDTQVTIYDGQTVVLGGLMREDVQKVQDKTPILGDIPLAGSLFRSSANQRIKRNLLIFVSAGLLDPAGQPLIKSVEKDKEILVPDAKALNSEAIPGDPSTASKHSR
jgi:general secretion pathway protein D